MAILLLLGAAAYCAYYVLAIFFGWRRREAEVQKLSSIWGDNHVTNIRRVVIRRRRAGNICTTSLGDEIAAEIDNQKEKIN